MAARPDARAADRLADEDDDRAAWSPTACRAGAKVRITKEALRLPGLGRRRCCRAGKRIGVETMLYGLLLPSGNDAAIALAQRAGRARVPRFVRADERARARRWASSCTHFTLARAASSTAATTRAPPTSRRSRARCCASRGSRGSCARRQAVLPFPIKGGKLYLYNNNPLLRQGYPRRRPGVKTGYTDAAGRCLVATARRGPVRLGVVLLHSPDPGDAGAQLLDRGFRPIASGYHLSG